MFCKPIKPREGRTMVFLTLKLALDTIAIIVRRETAAGKLNEYVASVTTSKGDHTGTFRDSDGMGFTLAIKGHGLTFGIWRNW